MQKYSRHMVKPWFSAVIKILLSNDDAPDDDDNDDDDDDDDKETTNEWNNEGCLNRYTIWFSVVIGH